MTPRTKEQNEEIRLQRLVQIRKAAADVFLNKGPLLEIRDVAAQAGLGYGTVYHYYSNKNDLLHDLLWDALDRARGWLEASLEAAPQKLPLGAQLKDTPGIPLETGLRVPLAPASGEAPEGGHFVLAAAASLAADSRSEGRETADSAELGPVAVAGIRLLQLWAEDHALYLLHKLAGEGFASLPEARQAPLSAAFHQEVLAPMAALLLEPGHAEGGVAASGVNAMEPPYRLQRAEMLLAALVGCASLALRRGKLHEEARDIARVLKL